jgi:hypothetical protein
VKFTSSKVLYDISLLCKDCANSDNNFDPFYDAIPLENVDSIMVNDVADVLSEMGFTVVLTRNIRKQYVSLVHPSNDVF